MRIAVIGLGLVGLSDALALARHHEVVITGPVPERVDAINQGAYPLEDAELEKYTARHALTLRATLDTAEALDGADMVLIAPPLSFDPESGAFLAAELESRIEFAYYRCPGVPIVIRSCVPTGFTQKMRTALGTKSLTYAPEFRRPGHALHDALYPKFVIVGDTGALGARVGAVLIDAALTSGVEVRLVEVTEAEAIKHASTAYFAARQDFLTELGSDLRLAGFNADTILDALMMDPRIGSFKGDPYAVARPARTLRPGPIALAS